MKSTLVVCLLLLSGLVTSCATIAARVPLDTKHSLVVETIGVTAKTEVLCLNSRTIQSLIGSEIPPDVPQQSCYKVILLSSDSSSIAKAVSAYVNAEKEFSTKVTGTSNTVASTIVEEAASSMTKADVVKGVNKLTETLTDTEAEQVTSEIKSIQSKIKNPSIKTKLDAALKALKER